MSEVHSDPCCSTIDFNTDTAYTVMLLYRYGTTVAEVVKVGKDTRREKLTMCITGEGKCAVEVAWCNNCTPCSNIRPCPKDIPHGSGMMAELSKKSTDSGSSGRLSKAITLGIIGPMRKPPRAGWENSVFEFAFVESDHDTRSGLVFHKFHNKYCAYSIPCGHRDHDGGGSIDTG